MKRHAPESDARQIKHCIEAFVISSYNESIKQVDPQNALRKVLVGVYETDNPFGDTSKWCIIDCDDMWNARADAVETFGKDYFMKHGAHLYHYKYENLPILYPERFIAIARGYNCDGVQYPPYTTLAKCAEQNNFLHHKKLFDSAASAHNLTFGQSLGILLNGLPVADLAGIAGYGAEPPHPPSSMDHVQLIIDIAMECISRESCDSLLLRLKSLCMKHGYSPMMQIILDEIPIALHKGQQSLHNMQRELISMLQTCRHRSASNLVETSMIDFIIQTVKHMDRDELMHVLNAWKQ
jgi:hypothetical protein